MCWSAEADIAAGLVVGAVAVDAARHVQEPRQRPLAALPVLLASHQLTEVLVWWGLDSKVSDTVWTAAIYLYLFVAFGLPLLVPYAVAAVEPDAKRRRLMGRLGAVGAVVAVALLAGVMSGPVGAVDGGNHVAYQAELWHGGTLTAIYVVATLGCALASSHRFVRTFGALNLVAVVILAWLTKSGFVSLWCGWAAITSLVIAVHLRRAGQPAPRPLRITLPRRGDGPRLRFPS